MPEQIKIERAANNTVYNIEAAAPGQRNVSVIQGLRNRTHKLNTPRGRYLTSLIFRKPTKNVGLKIRYETPLNVFTAEVGSDHVERVSKRDGVVRSVSVEKNSDGNGYGQRLLSSVVQRGAIFEG